MLLSIDSSAVTASAALTDGDKIIKNEFINAGLTHSETLLPIIKKVMNGFDYSDLDSIAVCVGPGSFTGVRIGVATAKGIAFINNTKCKAVSTLDAIAHNFIDNDCVICSVMDARRMQFYNALFRSQNGVIDRLTEDRAISVEDLRSQLVKFENVIIAGDGAVLCYNNLDLPNAILAEESLRYQNAVGVAKASEKYNTISADVLVPVYLRPSQAERELKLKRG